MSRRPLHLTYQASRGFELSVQVAFNRRAYEQLIAGKVYQEQIQAGVIANWSGTYPLDDNLRQACTDYLAKYYPEEKSYFLNKSQISFFVNLQTDPLSGVYPPRLLYFLRLFSKRKRPIPIYLKHLKIMPSHVASGLCRRFWGFFRYFKILSFGFNWSKNFPGYAVIHQYKNLKTLKSVSAHEFGHLFGLDDAYDAWYRFYYAAPDTENYMMHFNRQVQPQEIAMLIRAYTQNRTQFFPVKFNLKTIRKGFFREWSRYYQKLKKQ